jgi:oxygen-independent coproporphyrinogen-3 oxidase
MVGETDENWTNCIERVRQMDPDNITIYQMELPHNTLIAREMKQLGVTSPVASWATKRRWVNEAFDTLAGAGYHVSSAQELVKNPQHDRFVYRDSVWRGADLLATGVASFGHLAGVHYQNVDQLEDYLTMLEAGELPLGRALTPTPHQLLIREMVLQLKEGQISAVPFRQKFGVNILEEFREPLARQQAAGYLVVDGDAIRLTRKGLLQVDTLLSEYFEPEHRSVRYT